MWWLWPLSIIVFSKNVLCGYDPSISDFYEIDNILSGALGFPDMETIGNCQENGSLIGRMNFLTTPGAGNLLIGSADVLYMLNATTLNCEAYYYWPSEDAHSSTCGQGNVCHNYIRLYKVLPSDSSRLLVCGTQSSIALQCRTIQFTDQGFNAPTGTFGASNGLISNFPALHDFGEFREGGSNPTMDTTYFSGGYSEFDGSNTNIGRDYNLTFHNVLYNAASEELSITERFSVKDDPLWLNFPVALVDYYRADYGDGFEFYFVFLRESLAGDAKEVIYSRVVRICRNDPGGGGRFTTFVKARILCEREVPPGRDFVGSINYQYNEITSMVFNNNGRYAENKDWLKMMYGTFSGPRSGPRGTALCVYKANNDGQFNRGIFEVFREDLFRNGTVMDVENTNLMCSVNGRPSLSSNDVLSVQEVDQVGQDPLLVLDGVIVTKMVLDRVCIVQRDAPSQCLNQDVLFLGTDLGKILKVVFATLPSGNIEPVISEEISLGDIAQVDDMTIEQINGLKTLFVSTISKVYRMPLERCSRLQGCLECIRARDPYCVWNNSSRLCESSFNHLSATDAGTETVQEDIWQNIHIGNVEQCNAEVNCQVSAQPIDHQTIMCSAGCNNTNGMEVNITTSLPFQTSMPCLPDTSSFTAEGCRIFTSSAGLGLHSYDCFVESRFSAPVQTLPGPLAPFEEDSIYTSCGQTSCVMCVQMLDLTDLYINYAFQVYYRLMSDSMFMTTRLKRLSEGSECVNINITALTPGSVLIYKVELQNNFSSTNSSERAIMLQEGLSGPVQDLSVVMITNVSIILTWSPPSEPNGIILGYSVYIDDTSVLDCVQRFTVTLYEIDNLIPFTDYRMTVRACTSAGMGTESMLIDRKTLCGTPSSVVSVIVQDITSTGMTFQWSRPVNYNGNISNTEYKIITSIYEVTGVILNQINLMESNYRLSGTRPRTLCCAEIYAVTSCNNTRLTGLPYNVCSRTLVPIPASVSNLIVLGDTLSVNSFSLTWGPPSNFDETPGLTYIVTIDNRSIENLTDVTFLHIDGLSPCTVYRVQVSARSGAQIGPGSEINVATKSLLPPPENVRIINNTNGMLTAVWTRPEGDCFDSSNSSYTVNWRCSEFANQTTSSLSGTSTVIDTSIINSGIGWCVVSVQLCEGGVRCGGFSSQATVSLYQFPPPEPSCSLQTQTNSYVIISFALSRPFVTNSTLVMWNLTRMDLIVLNDSYTYNISSSNVLNFTVESNSVYSFDLRICNVYGCSETCDIEVKTFDAPLPPQSIDIMNVTNVSVLITWSSTSHQSISYSISLASSCPAGNTLFDVINATNYLVNDLCPNSNYTLAIRATDARVNKSSLYSEIIDFTTRAGVPTYPRFVRGFLEEDEKKLIITWIIPTQLNGDFAHYDVQWALSSTKRCDSIPPDNITVMSAITEDASTFQHIVDDVQGFVDIKSYSICVRAVTTAGTLGSWGLSEYMNVDQGGLRQTPDDCNTLTAVACVAALTVASSLIMSIILSISVVQKGWFCLKNEGHGEKTYPK